MNPGLQSRFRELATGERIYVGGKMATQNDLCALFRYGPLAFTCVRPGPSLSFYRAQR